MPAFDELARELVAIGHRFYMRGWVLGTSGNFSAVVSERPLRLAITASAAHKGKLESGQILEIDGAGRARDGQAGRPSAETRLHLEIVKRPDGFYARALDFRVPTVCRGQVLGPAPVKLASGDVVTLGPRVSLLFEAAP